MFVKKDLIITLFIISLFTLTSIRLQAQWETLRQTYHLLSTVAGKGDVDNGGENGWQNSFEGGTATAAELSRPHIAMADSLGNIYIADKDAHAIRKVDRAGIITTLAGTNSAGDGGEGPATEQALNAPNGLWVNSTGECYILDLNNDKIRKVNQEGNMVTLFEDPDGIILGRGLWVSDNEDTIWYASGSEVKMWTPDGGIVSYADGFSGLGNIVQDSKGYLVATDRTANKVYRIDKEGNKNLIAGNGTPVGGGEGFTALESSFYGVRGVWFLEDNSYFLATHEGSQVWYVDTLGITHLFLDGLEGDDYHSGDGDAYNTPGYKVSEVRAVTVDYQGNVLITENDRGFIRKIEKTAGNAIRGRMTEEGKWMYITSAADNGLLYIRFNQVLSGEIGLQLFDMNGRLLSEDYQALSENSTLTLDWPQKFPSGAYIIVVRTPFFFAATKWINR